MPDNLSRFGLRAEQLCVRHDEEAAAQWKRHHEEAVELVLELLSHRGEWFDAFEDERLAYLEKYAVGGGGAVGILEALRCDCAVECRCPPGVLTCSAWCGCLREELRSRLCDCFGLAIRRPCPTPEDGVSVYEVAQKAMEAACLATECELNDRAINTLKRQLSPRR